MNSRTCGYSLPDALEPEVVLAETDVGGYLGANLVPIFGLAALIVILMLRPTGLFATSTGRQV